MEERVQKFGRFLSGMETKAVRLYGANDLPLEEFHLPLTAIEDFREKGRTDSLFARLADSCDTHNGLWNAEAEKILFDHFGVK